MSKLGDGSRFKKLKKDLSRKRGVRNPAALAAWIGRKKFGDARFAELSSMGRVRADEARQKKRRIKI